MTRGRRRSLRMDEGAEMWDEADRREVSVPTHQSGRRLQTDDAARRSDPTDEERGGLR